MEECSDVLEVIHSLEELHEKSFEDLEIVKRNMSNKPSHTHLRWLITHFTYSILSKSNRISLREKLLDLLSFFCKNRHLRKWILTRLFLNRYPFDGSKFIKSPLTTISSYT